MALVDGRDLLIGLSPVLALPCRSEGHMSGLSDRTDATLRQRAEIKLRPRIVAYSGLDYA